jgi:hypothetical protein
MKKKRKRPQTSTNWLGLAQLVREYGMSSDFWRRATKALVDPLPCTRIGLGNPDCAKIMVHRGDAESWVRRRRDAKQVDLQAIVNDIARKVQGADR